MTIESKFLHTVSQFLRRRSGDVESILLAGYSFEEWCNWEIFLAAKPLGTALPRPAYANCGAVGSKLLGDLRLDVGAERLLVELAVVHDRTGDKWLPKLEKDRVKLSQSFYPGTRPLQVLLCGSTAGIRSDPRWTSWLTRLSFWDAPTIHDEDIPIGSGNCLLRAWRLP